MALVFQRTCWGNSCNKTTDQCRLRPNLVLLPGDYSRVSDALTGSLKRTSGQSRSLPGALAFQLLYEPTDADERSCRRGEAGRGEAVGVSNYSADQMRAHQLLADHGVRLA